MRTIFFLTCDAPKGFLLVSGEPETSRNRDTRSGLCFFLSGHAGQIQLAQERCIVCGLRVVIAGAVEQALLELFPVGVPIVLVVTDIDRKQLHAVCNGLGNFDKFGFSLITIRNGCRTQPEKYPKVYAEKLLYLKEGQMAANHFHWYKTEDIINRGGGNCLIRVYNSLPNEEIDYASDVIVHCDGLKRTVPAGTQIRLRPGESLWVTQGMYHDFAVEAGTGPFCSARSASATTTTPTTASTRLSAVFRKSRRTSRRTACSATSISDWQAL